MAKATLHMTRVTLEAIKPFFDKDFQEALDLIFKNNPVLEFHKLYDSGMFVLEYTLVNPLKYVTVSLFNLHHKPTMNDFMDDLKKGFTDEHVFIPRFSSVNELKMKYLLKRT